MQCEVISTLPGLALRAEKLLKDEAGVIILFGVCRVGIQDGQQFHRCPRHGARFSRAAPVFVCQLDECWAVIVIVADVY